MWIKSLTISNCRLLKDISLNLSSGLNLIIGPNASGKTSFLESLSILSNGRSFRTSHIAEVISHNKDSILVAANVKNGEISHQIGVEKSQSKTKIRINQTDVFTQAELSSHLPITVIHPNSIDLITGAPSVRRAYLDWIAFYIYPDFYHKWKKYQHILKQRNFCLKDPKHHHSLVKWTEELVLLQPTINTYREQVIKVLLDKVNEISRELLPGDNIHLELQSGFSKDITLNTESLLDFYNTKIEYDIKLKRTNFGVHKADLKIFLGSKQAVESASRGQLKLLAISLLLAQSSCISRTGKTKGILLIDDLAAELDKSNRKLLLKYLSGLNKQLIITTTKRLDFEGIEAKLFHVKHGIFKN